MQQEIIADCSMKRSDRQKSFLRSSFNIGARSLAFSRLLSMKISFGQKKSCSRSRIGQKTPREERNKKPTDNKQHNSDLKGDFQADSHGNLSRAEENEKKRPKGM